jgi:acetyl esterase/lipase
MLFEGGNLVRDFLGGTRQEMPEIYQLASPVFQVRPDSPPVFLYHGSRDEIVPPVHAAIMKSELDAAGVPMELFWLEGKGHVSAFIFGGQAEERAIDFLDRVLK